MAFDMSSAALGFAREALISGDPDTALGMLRQTPPTGAEGHYWLASALLATGDAAGAASAMAQGRRAQTLDVIAGMGADLAALQTDAAYADTVAVKLYGGQNVGLSGEVSAMAVAAGLDDPQGWLRHGLALQHQGRAEEAIAVFQQALQRWPSAALHQFLLYPTHLVPDRANRYGAEARRWAELYADAYPATLPPRSPAGRKLRVGYVAPSFARTQIHQFIAPVLANHDREVVEVFLYPASAEGEDAWPQPTTVRPIGGVPDLIALEMIRRDQLDILVDCWGHSAGSRLLLFGHRCAPIQAAWINFVETTGLAQMDYVLHADSDLRPALAPQFTETLWPIGPVFNAFRPSPDRLDPTPAPALTTGQVTFGSFNHPCKLTDHTLDLWAQILRGAPAARLVLKYGYFVDPVLRRVTQARFAGRGVDPERIHFRGHSAGADYFAAFREIDLALDPRPAPGSTTTLDALANGLPVLVVGDETVAGLYSRSILQACGLADLVCATDADYVRLAVALASDTARLDALRARVRPGFDNGPIRDEAGFTRRLEAAFGEMAQHRLQTTTLRSAG